MKFSVRTWIVVALAASVLATTPALADTTASSTIAQMTVLTAGDSNHKLYHGAIWLHYDKANHNYRWGGEQCGDKGLTDTHVGMLFAAFRSKYSVTVLYKKRLSKQGQVRCITGFTVSR
jgi:hypothetical protein